MNKKYPARRLEAPSADAGAAGLRAARHALSPGVARPAAPGADRVRPLARGARGIRAAGAAARPSADTADRTRAAFWRVKGARELTPAQAAVLQALFAYREQQAERMDRPPFKVMGEATLMELARRAPRARRRSAGRARHDAGADPPPRARRAARGRSRGSRAPAQRAPQADREPDEVRDRYDRLHTWRKERARARGVESDVILPRTALWDLARRAPRTARRAAQTSPTSARGGGRRTAGRSSPCYLAEHAVPARRQHAAMSSKISRRTFANLAAGAWQWW